MSKSHQFRRRRPSTNRRLIAAWVATSAVIAATARAEQQTATWLGGSGAWTDASKWSTGTVPFNSATTTYVINIDGGNAVASDVTLQPSSNTPRAIDSLTVTTGDALVANVSIGMTLGGPLTIDGTMDVYGPLRVAPGAGGIAGTGTLIVRSRHNVSASSGVTTIPAGLTVRRGAGDTDVYFLEGGGLGNPSAPLVNFGRLINDRPLTQLRLSGSSIDNRGTIEVRNGGYLEIDADFSLPDLGTLVEDGGGIVVRKTLENTGRVLEVDRSEWVLAGRIRGGAIRGVRDVTVPYLYTATLDGVTLDGVRLVLSGSLNIVNGISGVGTITYGNPEAIEGTGNITVETLPAGITIRGGLTMFEAHQVPYPHQGQIRIKTNNGTIRADRGGAYFEAPRLIQIATPAIENSGSIEVSPDCVVSVHGANFYDSTRLTFADNGRFLVDGGGLMNVQGILDLLSPLDTLDVRPRAGGGAYDNQLIATVSGGLLSTFNHVTPGISVTYIGGEIRISGTPIPEPGLLTPLAFLLLGSRRSRFRRGPKRPFR